MLVKDEAQMPVKQFFDEVFDYLRQCENDVPKQTLDVIHRKWGETLSALRDCETRKDYQFYQLLCLYQQSFEVLKDDPTLDDSLIFQKMMNCYSHLYSTYDLKVSEMR